MDYGPVDQQEFCAVWLEQHGVHDHPTLQQLMEMAEAWAVHRLRRSRRAAAVSGAASTPDANNNDSH